MLHIVNQYKKMFLGLVQNNLEQDSFGRNEKKPLTQESISTANTLEDMVKLINNSEIDLNNKEHKDFLKRFIKEIAKKNGNATVEDADIAGLSNERHAFSSVVNLLKSLDQFKGVEGKIIGFTDADIKMVNDFIGETDTVLSVSSTASSTMRQSIDESRAQSLDDKGAGKVDATSIDISKINVSLFTRTLKQGMNGPDVQELNKFLIAKTKMFSLKEISNIDTFDSKTYTMLWNYQKKLGVQNPDGILTVSKTKEYNTLKNIKKDVLNSANNNFGSPVQELPDNQTDAHVNITGGNSAPENKDSDYNTTLNLLSDLNSDNDLDDQNVLDEKSLKTALSQLSNGNKDKLLTIYKNVVGYSIDNIDGVNSKIFHDKLVSTLQFMTSLGINSGLYSVLKGDINSFSTEIMKLPLEKRKIQISNIDKLSPGIQNTIGALVSAGVLVLTQGVVAVSREVKQYDGNEVVEKIEKSKEDEPLSKLKQFLTFIKDAFTGRRLSFSIGEDDTINVRKFEEDITKYATSVLDLKLDGTDTLPDGLTQDKYKETLELSKQFGLDINKPEDKKIVQGILIQDFILSQGVKRQGIDWKATIGLLFIGAHRDKIGVEYVPTVLNDAQAKIERDLTRVQLNSDILNGVGISVNKKENKFEHILPEEGSMIKLPGDDRDFPIKEIKLPEGVTRESLSSSDTKYDFHFSFVGGRGNDYYVLSLTPSSSTSSGAKGEVSPKQGISSVTNIREGKEVLSVKNLDQVLYDIVGHRVSFGKLAKAISRGDLEATKKELDSLSSQYKNNKEFSSYIKLLKDNLKSFSIWDSYMSGSKETRRERSPAFDKVRTQSVIKAENALAEKTGFPKPSSEENFKVNGEYKSVQVSQVFAGQEITSVQFMTPADNTSKENLLKSRSSLHRVSVVDGSFAISEKYQVVTDDRRKQEIVEGLLNSSNESRAIKNQVKKLNEFLSKHNKKIEEKDYISFLKSGKLEDLKVPGLKLQDGTETKFLEARAMVAGNVCLNATYAIAYPAFEIDGDNQKVESVITSDYTAASNYAVVEGIESGIGINPVAAALLNRGGGSGGPKGSSESTTTGGDGTTIPGGVPNAPNVAAGGTTATTTTTGTGFIKP